MILQYSYCAADAKWNRGHLQAEAPAQSPGPLGLFSVHLSPLGLGGVVATDYAGLVQEGQAVVSGAVDPAGSDSPLLIADHCLAVYPCSIASLYIRVSRRCRCVRTSPSSVTATQRSVLVGQGPNARHIRSAWSMRSVTTLHKYEQQRTGRGHRAYSLPSHICAYASAWAWGYRWGLLVWCGVSTRKRVVDYLFQL